MVHRHDDPRPLATTGSTPGDQPPATESQPITRSHRLVAHNGVLPEAPTLIDSHHLLHIWENGDDPHAYLRRHPGRHALLTADLHTRTLVASTTGQPLHTRTRHGVTVITSWPVGEGWTPITPRATPVTLEIP